MLLEVKRDAKELTYTLGEFYVDGEREYYTVEDTVRERPGEPVSAWKIQGITAIPAGEYNVIITMSARFKRMMPLLENVPGFTGVRIHGGNTAENTDGCIVVGMSRNDNGVYNCAPALKELQASIQAALDAGEKVTIKIG